MKYVAALYSKLMIFIYEYFLGYSQLKHLVADPLTPDEIALIEACRRNPATQEDVQRLLGWDE